jgi:multiple antibiotic resistance protein
MLFFALCGAWILHYLAIPLLAGPATIQSVVVVSSGADSLKLSLLGLSALAVVVTITAVILIATKLAEAYTDTLVTSVFSRITAIILAALSIQYIIDGLQTLDGLTIS